MREFLTFSHRLNMTRKKTKARKLRSERGGKS